MARGSRYRSGHELLTDLSPVEWAYMLASFRLDPYGDSWMQVSAAAAAVCNMIQAVAVGLSGGDAKPPRAIPDDFLVPYREHGDPESDELEESLKDLESLRGW